jgi:adenylate cyclase
MSTEIERAFVVAERPPADALGTGRRLRQGYLAIDGATHVRVRIGEDAAKLTVKAGHGLSRTEVEVPLSADQAEALWPHTAGRQLEKVRHELRVGDHTIEVDVYLGALDGLCRAEVEFGSETAAEAFDPPAWLGHEVTGDPAWGNASLAVHGRPDA